MVRALVFAPAVEALIYGWGWVEEGGFSLRALGTLRNDGGLSPWGRTAPGREGKVLALSLL